MNMVEALTHQDTRSLKRWTRPIRWRKSGAALSYTDLGVLMVVPFLAKPEYPRPTIFWVEDEWEVVDPEIVLGEKNASS